MRGPIPTTLNTPRTCVRLPLDPMKVTKLIDWETLVSFEEYGCRVIKEMKLPWNQFEFMIIGVNISILTRKKKNNHHDIYI